MARRSGPPALAAALAAVTLAAGAGVALGETLPVEAGPCPDDVPEAACFGTEASRTVDWAHAPVGLPKAPTVAYVQNLLQTCLEIEHSTIPLYLTTMYSIPDTTSFAYRTMRSVVMEEMLHMVNAANVINAIGGKPYFDKPGFIPQYPLVLPQLNMTADIVWFTQSSVSHYQTLESTPPGGYNTSISAAYLHVVNVLTALVHQHHEENIFVGNHSLQVNATIASQQSAKGVYGLDDTRDALLGVADQGGGCPITGKKWPMYSSILAGQLGGNYSHAARYEEILLGRSYNPTDEPGIPTGPNHTIDWEDVRRFAPNPSTSDFLPEQCVDGGSWVVRNSTFFVRSVWDQHAHHLAVSNETSWQDCAKKCINWTINYNRPLEPCAMWSWRNASAAKLDRGDVLPHSCLLAQGGGPVVSEVEGFMSGCQFGTVCNQSLPGGNVSTKPVPPSPALKKQCEQIHQMGIDFASNYTAILVKLHDTFNGNPDGLMDTIGDMYNLKSLAIQLMETPDPRIETNTMGVGPPWEFIPAASRYYEREGLPVP